MGIKLMMTSKRRFCTDIYCYYKILLQKTLETAVKQAAQ